MNVETIKEKLNDSYCEDSFIRKECISKKHDESWKFINKDYHLLLGKRSNTFTIKITDNFFIELPRIFNELACKIEDSKSITALQENWDDEGSVGYKQETYIQAVDFLAKYAIWIWDAFNILIDTPEILPAQNGSIDLFWKKGKYDLLINIPPYPNAIAKFYGDDKKVTKIEGEFPLKSHNQGIFLCLLNNEE